MLRWFILPHCSGCVHSLHSSMSASSCIVCERCLHALTSRTVCMSIAYFWTVNCHIAAYLLTGYVKKHMS